MIRRVHALWNVRKGRRVKEDRETAQPGACPKESDETVEGEFAGRSPAQIDVDAELFEVWPQLYGVVFSQMNSLVESDLWVSVPDEHMFLRAVMNDRIVCLERELGEVP
jgi:hypothetical protein